MTLVKIRKVISGIIFVLFVLLFLGPEKWSVFLSDVIAPFQFVPSLVQTATAPSGLFMAGFIFIVLMTLIFGRVYCSFLCPLGTLQDLIIAGSRRLGLLPGHAFAGPHNGLRYALLASTAAAAVIGSLSLVSLLDPYSLAGRFFSHFLQPLVVGAYNLGIAALKPFDVYWYPKQTAFVPLSVLAATAAFFLLILYLAATRGRLYCNTVCPVGTFLGLVARFSVFQLTVNPKACSECVRCENVCKAGCIDSHNAFVDMSRCIGCLNCLDACSQSAIRYRRRQRQPHAGAWSPSRRGFVMGGIAAAAALLALNTKLRAWIDIRRAQAEPPVTPPGSRDIAHFTRACTACSLCVSVCPTQVLTPAFMDFGASGLMQPKMNYEKAFVIMNAASAAGSARPARSRRFLWRRKSSRRSAKPSFWKIFALSMSIIIIAAPAAKSAPRTRFVSRTRKIFSIRKSTGNTASQARVNWPAQPRPAPLSFTQIRFIKRRRNISAPKRRSGKRSRPMMNFLFERKKSTAVID